MNQSKILKKHQFNTTKNTFKNNKKKKGTPTHRWKSSKQIIWG
jgi:hypothetical protein